MRNRFTAIGIPLAALAAWGGAGCSGSVTPGLPRDSSGQADPEAPGGGPATSSTAGGNVAPPALPSASAPALGRGVLDCPTAAYPGSETAAAQPEIALSRPFQVLCGSCHGVVGEGKGRNPSIPGRLGLTEFVNKVRSGTENMPPFAADVISDAELAADFRALSGAKPVSASGPHPHPSFAWTDEQVDAAYRTGIALWRKPDPKGAACAHCHTPDAVDLALIAYPDDAILRRALQHLPAEDCVKLVDFVHAQRRRFAISSPCSRDWRPFQPRGEPLPGATVGEQDAAFAEAMASRRSLLFSGTVDSLDDAKRARDEVVALNLRTLPIGIPLPRWTEDRFNGEPHRSLNDWITAIPRIPNDGRWFHAIVDRYLADPSTPNLRAVDDAILTATHPGMEALTGTFAPQATEWLQRTMLAKARSALLASHLMRLALLGKPSWAELPQIPMPDYGRKYNPMTDLGFFNAEPPCGGPRCEPDFKDAFPESIRADVSSGMQTTEFTADLSHPWSTLGQLFEPSLIFSENTRGPTLRAHYWNVFTFFHAEFHKPFFAVHRVLLQDSLVAARPEFLPAAYRARAVRPLLDSDWIALDGLGLPDNFESVQRTAVTAERAIRLRVNIAKTVLFLQRELLEQGHPIAQRKPDDHLPGMSSVMNSIHQALSGMHDALGRRGSSLEGLAHLRTSLVAPALALFAEVNSLVASARELYVEKAP